MRNRNQHLRKRAARTRYIKRKRHLQRLSIGATRGVHRKRRKLIKKVAVAKRNADKRNVKLEGARRLANK